jgi:hypothetical protein
MSNVIPFPLTSSVQASSADRLGVSAELIYFSRKAPITPEWSLYKDALWAASSALRDATNARKRRAIWEWRDEIEVIALHSEWLGFRDISACCRNILRVG